MNARRVRPPWWLVVVGAAFLLYYALLVYCDATPVKLGLELSFIRQDVDSVVAGSQADRAGIRAGDSRVEVNGQAIGSILAWRIVTANVKPGSVLRVRVERAGVPAEFHWVVAAAPAALADRLTLWMARGVQFVTLCLALAVAYKRPADPVALVCALFLAGMAVYSVRLPDGFAMAWRVLPSPAALLLWLPFFIGYATEPLLFVFCAIFPNGNRWSPTTWLALLAPAGLAFIWRAWFGIVAFHAPQYAQSVPDWSSALAVVNASYGVLGLGLLLLNYRRLDDRNQRRRMRVLMLGSLVGLAGGLPLTLSLSLFVHVSRDVSFAESREHAIETILVLALPISFAYATIRHRMFDVSVMLRLGLRYTLARRLTLSAVPVLAAAIALDIWWHRGRELSEGRGVVYFLLLALLGVVNVKRHAWLVSLDRRFFRERYNAQRVLRQLADEIRQSGDLARVAPVVVEQIESALHPEFVQVLVRPRGQAEYQVVAAAPASSSLCPISASSKLLGILRVLERPLEVPTSETGWFRQLPPAEQQSLRASRIDLLVPITLSPTHDEAMVVLGARRSEEPYSAEDHDLVGAIAGSLALIVEDAGADADVTTGSFDECPDCGVCYDSGTGTCTNEGARLAAVSAPRVLAARYRIDRRLGRGGMGSVYAAVDLSLERDVAAKLVRDELVADLSAGERFRREARVAAGLTHPHVVTIYDFGITEGRAFLIMELVHGPTLRQELQRFGRMSPPRVHTILTGICAAAEAAHARRLVHRDLKPENVMLTAPGSDYVKVVDFGVAKALPAASASTSRHTGGFVGTLQYMAPEQLRCEEVSPSWDLWAIAVMAHELLTGVLPYTGRAGAALTVTGTSPHSRAHDVERWDRFFDRTLALDVRQRPQTPALLLAEFDQVLV